MGLYQDPKAYTGHAQRAGNKVDRLHRQSADNGRDARESKGPHQNLGFIVHPVTTPTQEVEFLGVNVHTPSKELCLLGEKIKKLRGETRKLLAAAEPPSVREVARLVGKMNAVSQAIPPTPLFFRQIQRDLTLALDNSGQCYDTPCPLSAEAAAELDWWTQHLPSWNGKSLVRRKPDSIKVGYYG